MRDRAAIEFPDVDDWPDLTDAFGTLLADFDDDGPVDISGPLRVTRLGDTFYVVGRGICTRVKNRKEGKDLIRRFEHEVF